MSHHQGRNAPPGGSVEAVHVAAADAAGADADQDVVGADFGPGHLDHFEMLIFFQQKRIHPAHGTTTRKQPRAYRMLTVSEAHPLAHARGSVTSPSRDLPLARP